MTDNQREALTYAIDLASGKDCTAVAFRLGKEVQYLTGPIAKDIYSRLARAQPTLTFDELMEIALKGARLVSSKHNVTNFRNAIKALRDRGALNVKENDHETR